MIHRFLAIAATILPTMSALGAVECHHYIGVVSQPSRTGEPQVLREFEVIVVRDGDQLFFSVLDDPGAGCPWPESFGTYGTADKPQPRIVQRYDGRRYSIVLPALHLELLNDQVVGAQWTAGDWTFEVTEFVTVDDTPAIVINAFGRRGRKQSLTVDVKSGVLFAAEQDVFMGQGEKFELTLQRHRVQKPELSQREPLRRLQSGLLEIQALLGRRPDSLQRSLSARQVAVATEKLETLASLADDTPLDRVMAAIRQDLKRQQSRTATSMQRQQELLDSSVPEFSLQLVSGETLDSTSLDDRVTVLHFWDYSERALSEPYGQIAYLEFLYNQQKSKGLQVVGIATAPALQQPDSRLAAKRSARKLMEFMNLTYPVGFDDGSLLKALGGSSRPDDELPLWVIIGADNRVIHYKTGYYEVSRQGLTPLSEMVTKALQTP